MSKLLNISKLSKSVKLCHSLHCRQGHLLSCPQTLSGQLIKTGHCCTMLGHSALVGSEFGPAARSFVITWNSCSRHSCTVQWVCMCVGGWGVLFPLLVCGSHDLLCEGLSWHKLGEPGWKITLLLFRFQPGKVVGTWVKVPLIQVKASSEPIADILGQLLPTIRIHLWVISYDHNTFDTTQLADCLP